MSIPNITEIKRRADIREVWSALGGGKLRRGRGQAFWRDGDGYSVSLDSSKGLWHDFVTGEGGDVVELVRAVRQCGFLDAAEWLASHTGVRISTLIRCDGEDGTDWATDLKWAMWWRIAAEMLTEQALEELPYWHPERRGLTSLLRVVRLGDAALVNEYREWRRRDPELTSGMCHAGRRSDARTQRKLAIWLRRYLDGAQTA
jgi:hypothetical protein